MTSSASASAIATVELGIISARSYLPIARAETMLSISDDSTRSDKPLRFLASLRRSLNMGFPPRRFTVYDALFAVVNPYRLDSAMTVSRNLRSQGHNSVQSDRCTDGVMD